MHDYAAKALVYEKSNESIYYWMIVSAEETHKLDIARREYQTAWRNLDKTSFRNLTAKLEKRYPDRAEDRKTE